MQTSETILYSLCVLSFLSWNFTNTVLNSVIYFTNLVLHHSLQQNFSWYSTQIGIAGVFIGDYVYWYWIGVCVQAIDF